MNTLTAYTTITFPEPSSSNADEIAKAHLRQLEMMNRVFGDLRTRFEVPQQIEGQQPEQLPASFRHAIG
ncbi:MAG: hypothetical protein WCC64_19705 [Aliidongia sp.]